MKRLTTREAEAQIEASLDEAVNTAPKTMELSSGWWADINADGTVTLEGGYYDQPMVTLSRDDLRAIGVGDGRA